VGLYRATVPSSSVGDPLKIKRRHLWTIAVAIVVVVLVILLALIAEGILVIPGASPPAPVTVSSVQFTLLQGTNQSGYGWFGPSNFSYTGVANGYPFVVAPGGGFTVPLVLENYDSVNHTLYSVQAATPFTYTGSSPPLPVSVYAHQDDAVLQLSFSAPSSPGESLTLFVTVDFLGPS
jgi:hypothetical protein